MTTLLSNRYQVLRVLGSGGFGQTFLAEDTQMPSRRICVIKQLKTIADNPEIYKIVRDRFQREAATLEALGKDNVLVPELYASLCDDNEFYLVQEWIDGKDLHDLVLTEGCLTASKVQKLLLDLLPTLEHIRDRDYIGFSRFGQFIRNSLVFSGIYSILWHNYRRHACQNALTSI